VRALILFASFISSAPCFGAEEQPVLDVAVKLHHSVQWTRIFNGSDGWYCSTENNKNYPLREKPKALALVRDKQESKKSCRETFTAKTNDGKTWSGCRTGDAVKFLRVLGRECGRF
jgi:hypothetical protein